MSQYRVRVLSQRMLPAHYNVNLPISHPLAVKRPEGPFGVIEITPAITVGPSLKLALGTSESDEGLVEIELLFSTGGTTYLTGKLQGGNERSLDDLCKRLVDVLDNPAKVLDYAASPIVPVFNRAHAHH